MTRRLVPILIVLSVLALPALAQSASTATSSGHGELGFRSWGVRAGAASDPDQFLVGLHFNFGEFIRNLRFQPDAEIGFGDDATTISVSVPVHYHFNVDQPFQPYAGGGLRFSYVDFDLPAGVPGDSTDSDLGLELVGGLEWGTRGGGAFFVELSLIGGDIHDYQLTAGWSF